MYSVINYGHTPLWQKIAKRSVDVLLSSAGIILLSPLIFYTALRVRFSSRGPVIYSQERVGYRRKKFMMYKFRSMFVGAEPHGPRLATPGDARITAWGRTMRRWKLDELPQLWNVLAGDMSLVGPRPEREYFINQLENKDHPVHFLLQVKPGLTSLGMIKFGYANDLAQMSERMKFDLAYIENRSLVLDMKIIADTLKVIIDGPDKRE